MDAIRRGTKNRYDQRQAFCEAVRKQKIPDMLNTSHSGMTIGLWLCLYGMYFKRLLSYLPTFLSLYLMIPAVKIFHIIEAINQFEESLLTDDL